MRWIHVIHVIIECILKRTIFLIELQGFQFLSGFFVMNTFSSMFFSTPYLGHSKYLCRKDDDERDDDDCDDAVNNDVH